LKRFPDRAPSALGKFCRRRARVRSGARDSASNKPDVLNQLASASACCFFGSLRANRNLLDQVGGRISFDGAAARHARRILRRNPARICQAVRFNNERN
jgi:hypothetical protein